MSKMMKEYYEPVGSMSTQTLSISNKSIENGMNMFNIHAIIVKSVKINKEWYEVNDITTEIGNVYILQIIPYL